MTKFGDLQVELELAGFTLPCARGQISMLEKATIGLLGQVADRLAEGICVDQVREGDTLLLDTDFRHFMFSCSLSVARPLWRRVACILQPTATETAAFRLRASALRVWQWNFEPVGDGANLVPGGLGYRDAVF